METVFGIHAGDAGFICFVLETLFGNLHIIVVIRHLIRAAMPLLSHTIFYRRKIDVMNGL